MTFNAEAKLNDARTYLQELEESIKRLEESFPDIFLEESFSDVFDDSRLELRFKAKSLKSLLQHFHQEYEAAFNRLNAPTLSIATLGTTSSGKSTIVNALLGRKIAPMEAGEMSGGVLKFQHSLDEHQVFIDATEGATWQTGGLQGNGNDKVLYDRILSGAEKS